MSQARRSLLPHIEGTHAEWTLFREGKELTYRCHHPWLNTTEEMRQFCRESFGANSNAHGVFNAPTWLLYDSSHGDRSMAGCFHSSEDRMLFLLRFGA